MLKQFRSYQVAVQFYRQASVIKAPGHLKSQLLRASSSVVLNLSEGSARPSEVDRQRFYSIALGSVRECQSILNLLPTAPRAVVTLADQLGAHVYRLTHKKVA
jgi:four helix bundle protein